jgi:Spy/CpxP family protein refolding chaperone
MFIKSIPVVHPRVIEISRGPSGFAVSLGAGCGAPAPATGGGEREHRSGEPCCEPRMLAMDPEGGLGFGGFGVRRPLRFLAYKLDLTEPQMTEMAAILDELKTERAQSAVDDRRTLSHFADAMSGEAFDATKATEGAALREKSADRLGGAVVKALGRLHRMLTPEQRERFAYLIRTGTILL